MTPEEELRQLRQENKMLPEIIQQQQELIEQLQQQVASQTDQVKALQNRLTKDSHTSSLPPSSDRFVRQPKSLRKKSGKKSGGQDGHTGSSLQWSASPDEVVCQPVEQSQVSQQDLHAVAACHVECRQVVDVPAPAVVVREYRAEQKQCPHCGTITTAAFPKEVAAPLQYGPSIGAPAVYLVQQQWLPLARASEVMADLLGVRMSEGTICDLIQRCGAHLTWVEQQIKEALINAWVIHQDETGLYVAGKRYWEHVTCTPTLTHSHVDASRGQPALEAIGILPQFKGISIHDGWGSYFLSECEHAACLVHILRELIFLWEEHAEIWANALNCLLLDRKEAREQAREQGKLWLDPLEVLDWEVQFLKLLSLGDHLHPHAVAPPGTRGRCKQSAARNLRDRLRKHQKAMLCFLKDLRVSFDNNLAERDLRMIKVQQKVSGCFRSLAGAQAFRRIRGSLSTLRKQGLPLLSALQATLCGHPLLPSFQ